MRKSKYESGGGGGGTSVKTQKKGGGHENKKLAFGLFKHRGKLPAKKRGILQAQGPHTSDPFS